MLLFAVPTSVCSVCSDRGRALSFRSALGFRCIVGITPSSLPRDSSGVLTGYTNHVAVTVGSQSVRACSSGAISEGKTQNISLENRLLCLPLVGYSSSDSTCNVATSIIYVLVVSTGVNMSTYYYWPRQYHRNDVKALP